MTRLYIWRHGRTLWNAEHRVQGQTDVALDETGHRQAAEAAQRLALRRPDAIVSSDLRRAVQTAEYLAEATGLPIQLDDRLREQFFGEWQGLTDTELAERYPVEYARWRSGGGAHTEVGMESRDELAKRSAAAFLDAAAVLPGGTTVIAAHGGTAKYGMAALLGWPAELTRTVAGMANCHWIELLDTPRRGWQLISYNAH